MQSRIIPSIEQLRQRPALRALEISYGRSAVVEALREEAAALRNALTADVVEPGRALPSDAASASTHLERAVEDRLRRIFRGSLHPVINATGVVIHTNLGRAPLCQRAIACLADAARGYSNLEFDLATGHRGRREAHAAVVLTRLTGAEAALVVNNNAAATLLILSALAAGREVVISRGELVEIGGGFRVPDVMAQSGALLREVGTTNKTRIADYAAALGDRTALILRVHRSNFRIEGFTEQPTLGELVALGRTAGVPVVEDLGSGCLHDLAGEPTVQASVAAGFDLVCFSGDKLLGGPQAGIIVGRQALVDRLARHPLLRAVRPDKLTYAALEGTLLEYATGRAMETVPVLRMLTLPADTVKARASAVIEGVGRSEVFEMEMREAASMVGGGSAPGVPVPSWVLALQPVGCSAVALDAALRNAQPPVVARVEQEMVLLDLRTVLPEEDAPLVEVLRGLHVQ